jgi:DNA-binding transcriptional LysR family regulator
VALGEASGRRAPARSAPIPAATTNATPANATQPGCWPNATNPTATPIAGSTHISVPNAAVVSRRNASSSRLNGITGSSTARPRPVATTGQVSSPATDGAATHVATSAATGNDTARPCIPDTVSPTRCVNRMYAAQHAAAASANPTPTGSAAPRHGCVNNSTPAAATPAHTQVPRRPRATATPSGPRNSNALAVPNGSRATAPMNNMVTPAVTTPSATHVSNAGRVKARSRGRTRTSRITPAQASRTHAAPSGPTWSNNPTDTARPTCTHSIATTAIDAPARGPPHLVMASDVVMTPVNENKPSTSTRESWTHRSTILNNQAVETRRLQLLLNLSRLGSMHDVADELGITTSTVSQQLAALARDTGAALTEPHGRRVRLTPAGRRLADHAVTILAAVDAATRDLNPAAEPTGTVRVAGFATAIRRSLVPIVARLATTHPHVTLHIHEHEPSESLALLATDDVDLALVYDYNLAPATFDRTIHTTPLWSANWNLAIPTTSANAPAGDAATILGHYRHHPWIVNSRNTADETVVRAIAAIADYQPHITHRADSLDLVQDLIVAGLGISLLPADQPTRPGITLLGLNDPPVRLRSYAATRRGHNTWPPLALVLGQLTRHQPTTPTTDSSG